MNTVKLPNGTSLPPLGLGTWHMGEDRRRAAHSLKSSARIVGLMTLSRQMAELESRLSNPTGDVAPTDITAAQEKFDAVAPTLRAFSAPAPAGN